MITKYAVVGDVIYDFNECVFNDYDPNLKNFFSEIRFTTGWLDKKGVRHHDDCVVSLDLRASQYILSNEVYPFLVKMDYSIIIDDVVLIDKTNSALKLSFSSSNGTVFDLALVKRGFLFGADRKNVKIMLKNIIISLKCYHRCEVCESQAAFIGKLRRYQREKKLELTAKYVVDPRCSCDCAARIANENWHGIAESVISWCHPEDIGRVLWDESYSEE